MKRFTSIVMAACAVLIGVASVVPALPAAAQGSASLSIVPKKNYTIEPGKSVSDKLTIRNLDSQAPLILSLRLVDFSFNDDTGTPKLMLAEDAPQTTWSLKPFLTLPQTVTVPPKESKTVDMGVSIPEGQGAGSYYSAIVYSSGASEGGNVGLSASGVTLVFASVPGTVNENLQLEKFGAYFPSANGKEAYYTKVTVDQPQLIAYTLKNNGNVTESPVGSITVKNMFGKEQVIEDVNPNGSLALIGQSRTFTSCFKKKSQDVNFNGSRTEATACATPDLWPGYYTASLNLFYGQNGNRTQEITGNTSFWYLPMWSIVVLIVLLLIVAYFAWRISRFVRGMRGKVAQKKSARK